MEKKEEICKGITVDGEICQKKWGLCSDGKCINHSITKEAEKGRKLRKTLKRKREGHVDSKSRISGLKGKTYEEIYGAERVEEQKQKRKRFGKDNHMWRESLDKDWLHQKYWIEKLTLEQIADLCDYSAFYVRKMMGEYGIKRRRKGNNCKWTKEQRKAASKRMKKKCKEPAYKAQRRKITKEIANRPGIKEGWDKLLKDPKFIKIREEARCIQNPTIEIRVYCGNKECENMIPVTVDDYLWRIEKGQFERPHCSMGCAYKDLIWLGKHAEAFERRNEKIRKRCQDPEYRRQQSERIKEVMNRPGVKERSRERMKKIMSCSETRAKMDRACGSSICSWFCSLKCNSVIYCQSSYEFRRAIQLELDKGVISFKKYGGEGGIPYVFDGEHHYYYPDFVVEYNDGWTNVEEITDKWQIVDLRQTKGEKIKVAAEYFRPDSERGFIFLTKEDLDREDERIGILRISP